MAKGKKTEEPLVPVGPGADEEDIREESDEREEHVADEEPEVEERAEEEGDERVGHAEEQEDDGREAIRERRRAEKRRRKENRNRDRVELNYLRSRNEHLERRQSELDARVSQGEIVSMGNSTVRSGKLKGFTVWLLRKAMGSRLRRLLKSPVIFASVELSL